MSYSDVATRTQSKDLVNRKKSVNYSTGEYSVGFHTKSSEYRLTNSVIGNALNSVPDSDDTIIRVRDSLRRLQKRAIDKAKKFVDVDEWMEQANYGFDLKNILKQMWEFRNCRESNWKDLLNLVQIVFSSQELETYTKKQKKAFEKVIRDYLCIGTVEDEDVENAMMTLSENDLDVWCGFSEKL